MWICWKSLNHISFSLRNTSKRSAISLGSTIFNLKSVFPKGLDCIRISMGTTMFYAHMTTIQNDAFLSSFIDLLYFTMFDYSFCLLFLSGEKYINGIILHLLVNNRMCFNEIILFCQKVMINTKFSIIEQLI